jgi:hypothetical protein
MEFDFIKNDQNFVEKTIVNINFYTKSKIKIMIVRSMCGLTLMNNLTAYVW